MRPKEIYDKLEPVFRKSYQTPIVIEVNGKELLISNSSFMCFAHDVNTGEVIWTMEYGFDSTVSQPLYWNGLVFVNSGWIFEDNKPYFTREYAIDPTGKGDVTKTHVKWMYQDEFPQIPTPVIVDGKMYFVHDRGLVSCIDAATAKLIWKQELKGNFNSSPILAAGNLYFFIQQRNEGVPCCNIFGNTIGIGFCGTHRASGLFLERITLNAAQHEKSKKQKDHRKHQGGEHKQLDMGF